MAVPLRALALLLAGTALAACGGKAGPEDPAVAVGTGIPMGAMSASGVSFDTPTTHAAPVTRGGGGKVDAPPKPLPIPIDPFEPAPTPPPVKIPKKKGTSL